MVAETELAYWGGAIVVSVLAAGGMALATGDAQKVGSAMYAALKDTGGKAWNSIQAMAAWAASAGSKVKDAAFRVGADVWQAITDCFNKSYSGGKFSYTANVTSLTDDNAASACYYVNAQHLKSVSFVADGKTISLTVTADKDYVYVYRYIDGVYADGSGGISDYDDAAVSLYYDKSYGRIKYCLEYLKSGNWSDYGYLMYVVDVPCTIGTACAIPDSIAIPQPDLKYPGDDYLVKAPDLPTVDTGTGAVSWPSDAVYNKDAVAAPYPVGDDGVKVPDIPFDVPVDGTTGKALDDTGTDTDKPGTDTDKPGADTGGLLGQIVSLLKNFFDSPSDFRLNMDGFRNLVIKDKFPFCIPFDMVDSVKQFAADAADYQFRIKLDTQYFSVDHVVDLTPLAVPLAFFRYIVVTWFVWVLLSRTRDLMKW